MHLDQVMGDYEGEPTASSKAQGTPKPAEAERQNAKRQKIKATGPFIFSKTGVMEIITVPDEIVYSETLEQAIRDYNDFAQKQEKGNEVPPVPHPYTPNDKGR